MAPARAALPCSPQDAEPQSGVPGLRLTGSAGWAQTVPVTYQLYSLGQGAHLLGSPNPTWKRVLVTRRMSSIFQSGVSQAEHRHSRTQIWSTAALCAICICVEIVPALC